MHTYVRACLCACIAVRWLACVDAHVLCSLLAGRIYAFVELGFWIFCCVRMEITIVSWKALLTISFNLFTLPDADAFGPAKAAPALPSTDAWCLVKIASTGSTGRCHGIPVGVWFPDRVHKGPKRALSLEECKGRGWASWCGTTAEYKVEPQSCASHVRWLHVCCMHALPIRGGCRPCGFCGDEGRPSWSR